MWMLFSVLMAACGCRRAAVTPLESPWPELMDLDSAAARIEQRILSGVGRDELGRLSEELATAVASVLQSRVPETVTDPESVEILLRELGRGLELLRGGQSMNPDLLMRFHGLSSSLMQAAGMADLHQH